MASFIPTSEDLRILQSAYSGGTFYAHLLTTAPDASDSTVADLILATGGNYALEALTGLSVAADGTGAKLTFSNPQWVDLTTSGAAILGMAVIEQLGGSPASTDPLVSYVELDTPYTPNGASFTVEIPATGVLKVD